MMTEQYVETFQVGRSVSLDDIERDGMQFMSLCAGQTRTGKFYDYGVVTFPEGTKSEKVGSGKAKRKQFLLPGGSVWQVFWNRDGCWLTC
jgi:glutamine amidotransferase-like uncharacterized protein